jgi:hypothetical protein
MSLPLSYTTEEFWCPWWWCLGCSCDDIMVETDVNQPVVSHAKHFKELQKLMKARKYGR